MMKAKIIEWLRLCFAPPAPAKIESPVAPRSPMKIAAEVIARAKHAPEPIKFEVKRPVLPAGVLPTDHKDDKAYMALDSSLDGVYQYANETLCGLGFPGYPYLSDLTQRSEYRSPSETTATEMTRKWIRITSQGDGDLSEKIEVIEAELKRHRVQALFRKAAEQDGFFGRSQIFINIKGHDDPVRKLPLIIAKETIAKGSLLGFKNIEPLWTAPYAYNSVDPMAPDFFKPTIWFVMGKQVHASRLLSFVSREVPDMLKPAYNFGGLSMTQLMQPYVDSWLRTRNSVSDMLHSFSTSGILTDMSQVMSGGSGDDLFNRLDLFNRTRDNRGAMVLNKDTEEFFQFNVPLSSLDHLQAQSQEQMAAPCHTPLVKLFGITPSGLNANSDGEIKVYYDYIRAQQEAIFTDPLNKILHIIQLDRFGEIDPAIGFEYEPLDELDGEALARVRKSDSDSAIAYINAGVISPEEERIRLAADSNSGYNALDTDVLPTPPATVDGQTAGDLDEDDE